MCKKILFSLIFIINLSFWASLSFVYFWIAQDLFDMLSRLIVEEILKTIHTFIRSARRLVSTMLLNRFTDWRSDKRSGVVTSSANERVFMLSDSWSRISNTWAWSWSFKILSMSVLSWFLKLMIFQLFW